MSKPTRIIDVHQHAYWIGTDAARLVANMDAHGIASAWILGWDIPPAEDNAGYHGVLNPMHRRADGTHPGIPLSDLVATRDRYPKRFVIGYCPHPAIGSAPAFLEAAHKIHGARVCGEWKFRILFDDPRCLELYRKAGQLQMPVILHLDLPYLRDAQGVPQYQRDWYGGTVANLERALKACPATKFLGHAPGFWREISGDADRDSSQYPAGKLVKGGCLFRLFDTYPNLYGDLSANSGLTALKRDPHHAVEFLTRYQDRLLFGRDSNSSDLHNFLQTLKLPKAITEKIYHRNAAQLVPPL